MSAGDKPDMGALRDRLASFIASYAPKAREEAAALVQRWRVPTTVTVEDVQQELLMGVVQASGTFDPTRGMKWENYVLWEATALAKRWIHRQRGAVRLSGKSPTRSKPLFSLNDLTGVGGRLGMGETLLSNPISIPQLTQPAGQDEAVAMGERLDRAQRLPGGAIILGALAEAGADPQVAAQKLLNTPEFRNGVTRNRKRARVAVGRVLKVLEES